MKQGVESRQVYNGGGQQTGSRRLSITSGHRYSIIPQPEIAEGR